jgi:hypothetical protein
MSPKVYATVATRANGRCECGCKQRVPPGELDHMFGRKVEETEFVCWMLHPACHFRKTNSKPTAAYWLLVFMKHCGRHVGDGYVKAALEAEKKLAWLRAKGTSGEAAHG